MIKSKLERTFEVVFLVSLFEAMAILLFTSPACMPDFISQIQKSGRCSGHVHT